MLYTGVGKSSLTLVHLEKYARINNNARINSVPRDVVDRTWALESGLRLSPNSTNHLSPHWALMATSVKWANSTDILGCCID